MSQTNRARTLPCAALLAVILATACGRSPEPSLEAGAARADEAPPAPATAVASPVAALAPLFGGIVRQVGAYVVELVARPDGALEAHVRDSSGAAVPPEAVTVTATIDPGGTEPIEVPLTPVESRYVGTVVGVEGPRPLSISVEPTGGAELEVEFPPMPLAPVAVSLEPQHSGQVTVIGDNRVEVATAPSGEVYVSVTDLQGAPLPPDTVTLHQVTIVTPSGPRVVVLEPRGAYFVGALGVPPPPTFAVRFDLGVGGVWYHGVRLRRHRALPPGTVVVVPPRFHHPGRGWRKGWGPPGVGPHPGHGWAKGRGKAPGFAPGPPGVGRGGPPGVGRGRPPGPPAKAVGGGRGRGGPPPAAGGGRGPGGGRGHGKRR